MSRSPTGILPLAPAIEVKIIPQPTSQTQIILPEATHAFTYIHVAHVALRKFVDVDGWRLPRKIVIS